jgi:hypothetical protein
LAELKKQVDLSCLGVAKTVSDSQTDTGVKDAYTQFWINQLIDRAREMKTKEPLRSTESIAEELRKWVSDNEDKIYNPFLSHPGRTFLDFDLFGFHTSFKGFDPSKDTPVEILHTILLGVVKYLWHGTHTAWTGDQKRAYTQRLQATDATGLSIHAIRASYIMQYANSLIGRQLKTIAQTNAFHVYDLTDELQFLLTKAVGVLTALLWYPEIKNLDEYLVIAHLCIFEPST